MLRTAKAAATNQNGQLHFGIAMSENHFKIIHNRLEKLKEKIPISSTVTLRFQNRASCLKGILTIKSPNKTFLAQRTGHYTLDTFTHLEEDIESQILLWKKYRFQEKPILSDQLLKLRGA